MWLDDRQLPEDRFIAGFRPLPDGYAPDLRVLSLGAGVQSTTLFRLACCGEIEKPDAAIFADTGAEPPDVYRHLEQLEKEAVGAGIPLHVVQSGNIVEDIRRGVKGERFTSMPLHVWRRDGKKGMLRRQCTREYKIDPINQKIRELLGLAKGEHSRSVVEQWMGISCDEVTRMRRPKRKWMVNRYPLIELGMSRSDCLEWHDQKKLDRPPKSSCVFCPYHDASSWAAVRGNSEAWNLAVEVDNLIRNGLSSSEEDLVCYVHRSMQPLEELEDLAGQLELFEENAIECSGHCGV